MKKCYCCEAKSEVKIKIGQAFYLMCLNCYMQLKKCEKMTKIIIF